MRPTNGRMHTRVLVVRGRRWRGGIGGHYHSGVLYYWGNTREAARGGLARGHTLGAPVWGPLEGYLGLLVVKLGLVLLFPARFRLSNLPAYAPKFKLLVTLRLPPLNPSPARIWDSLRSGARAKVSPKPYTSGYRLLRCARSAPNKSSPSATADGTRTVDAGATSALI